MIMQEKSTVSSVAMKGLVYGFWLLFTVSQVGLLLWIHQILISAAIRYAHNAWVPRAVDMWSMFILGALVLAPIFFTEYYLDKGMKKGRFWQNVGKVALIEAIISAVLLVLGIFF